MRGGRLPHEKRRCQEDSLRACVVSGRVVAASASKESSVFIQKLPDRPMPAGLAMELNKFVELAKEPQLEELWTLVDIGEPEEVPEV